MLLPVVMSVGLLLTDRLLRLLGRRYVMTISLPLQVKKKQSPSKQAAPEEADTQTDTPLDTVFVSSEVAPWSKTGGLGDVVGSLPIALAKRGHRVMVVAPRQVHPQ